MRFVLKIAALMGLLCAAGFFVFVAALPRSSNEQAALRSLSADASTGMVILTGGAGRRIQHGLDLFAQGYGDRVLISGTHPLVDKEDLEGLGVRDSLHCCVDLGPRARTTIGNALEARDWARRRGYDTILLVTSDFHLPRALLELEAVAPELTVIGIAVDTRSAPSANWMRSPSAWRVLAEEYIKYILAWTRHRA